MCGKVTNPNRLRKIFVFDIQIREMSEKFYNMEYIDNCITLNGNMKNK